MNSVHAIFCGMHAFFVFERGGNAKPQGGREKRDPVRRPCGFAIRRQKRFDRFKADLKSAAVGFSYLL